MFGFFSNSALLTVKNMLFCKISNHLYLHHYNIYYIITTFFAQKVKPEAEVHSNVDVELIWQLLFIKPIKSTLHHLLLQGGFSHGRVSIT